MQKFLRHIELEITFSDAQRNPLTTEVYVSTGRRDGLAISFTVSKNLVGNPNECTVVITNMSPTSRQRLVSNVVNTAIKLFVNYEGESRTLLAAGDLLRAWPTKEGVENKMTLTFLDGISAILNSVTKKTWPPNTPIKTVVLDLAQNFSIGKSVYVDPTKINVDGNVGSRGLSINDKTSGALDALSKEYAFSWSIQNGTFQAYRDDSDYKEPSRRHYDISVKAANLIKCEPELGEKFMEMVGMKIEAVLNPKVIPMDIINLESVVYPQYSGTYAVHDIEFTGDTFGADWKMTISSKQTTNKAV